MYNLLRYLRQNKIKVITIVIFIIFGYSIIRTMNNAYYLKEKDAEANQKKDIVTIQKKDDVSLSDNKCQQLIKDFLKECTSGNYENAYNYLSNDCKKYFYNDVESFKNKYCNIRNIVGKNYFIEEQTGITNYTYLITFNDMLSSGKIKTDVTSNSSILTDYYTITVDNGTDIKLNINSYLKTIELNKNKEVNDLNIKINNINVFVNYQEINVTFTNGTNGDVCVDKSIYVTNENNNKIKQFEQDKVILEESEVKTINYQFYNSADIDLNSITFEKITFNYNIDNQNDNSLNINLR